MIEKTVLMLLLLSLASTMVEAQGPEVPDWELGWESETDPAIMNLDDKFDFELILTFWIDNSRPLPLEVEFTIEGVGDFQVDDPGKVTIEANSNKTFDLTLSGSALDAEDNLFSADSIHATLSLTASQSIQTQNVSNQEISKDLQFESYHHLVPTISMVGDLLAGTDEELSIAIINYGNSADSIAEASVSIKACPLMAYSGENVFDGVNLAIGGSVNRMITISAGNNHPDKTCIVTVSIKSEGSGLFVTSKELSIKVIAPEVERDSESSDSNDSNEDTIGYDVQDKSLPAPSLALTMVIFLFAAIIRPDNGY
ncbi:MAG: hypothetical protein ACKVIR_01160 [Candidatus Poseidoniales archaeon]